jgi:hypothetical protein
VVYYLMTTDYLEQRRVNNALTSQIGEAIQVRAAIPPPPTDLEQRLSAAQNALETARNEFPDQLNTTRIIDAILRLAEAIGVKAIPVITQPWTVESVSDQIYSVFRLSVTATGAYARLVDFINRLETSEPKSLVIESLTADRTTEIYEQDATMFEARLEIVVYTRPPAADE